MPFPKFTEVEETIVDDIRQKELENHYLVTHDGLTVIERMEHRQPDADLSPDIVSRLNSGERMRLFRNEKLNSGLSLRDLMWLGEYPGVFEVAVVTPSGSTYRATTNEWHVEDNYVRKRKQTIMRLSADLSLLIRPGTVEDPQLRALADRMSRHYLAQHLYGLGAIVYRAEQSPEDALIVAELYKTPLRQKWIKILETELK